MSAPNLSPQKKSRLGGRDLKHAAQTGNCKKPFYGAETKTNFIASPTTTLPTE